MFNSDGTLSSSIKTEITAAILPPGTLIYSAAASMGSGWLLADGSDVSRAAYPSLFTAIGTRYGDGNGTTTFTLPDFRGRSLIGAGQGQLGGSLTNRDISVAYVGEERHTQTIAEMPSHNHTWSGPLSRANERGDGANIMWRGSLDDVTGSTGGGAPFNVIHPCLIAFPFIKT